MWDSGIAECGKTVLRSAEVGLDQEDCDVSCGIHMLANEYVLCKPTQETKKKAGLAHSEDSRCSDVKDPSRSLSEEC